MTYKQQVVESYRKKLEEHFMPVVRVPDWVCAELGIPTSEDHRQYREEKRRRHAEEARQRWEEEWERSQRDAGS